MICAWLWQKKGHEARLTQNEFCKTRAEEKKRCARCTANTNAASFHGRYGKNGTKCMNEKDVQSQKLRAREGFGTPTPDATLKLPRVANGGGTKF